MNKDKIMNKDKPSHYFTSVDLVHGFMCWLKTCDEAIGCDLKSVRERDRELESSYELVAKFCKEFVLDQTYSYILNCFMFWLLDREKFFGSKSIQCIVEDTTLAFHFCKEHGAGKMCSWETPRYWEWVKVHKAKDLPNWASPSEAPREDYIITENTRIITNP